MSYTPPPAYVPAPPPVWNTREELMQVIRRMAQWKRDGYADWQISELIRTTWVKPRELFYEAQRRARGGKRWTAKS